MSSVTEARPLIQGNSRVYSGFAGMDRSLPRTAMERQDRQALWTLRNAYVDWRGVIRSDPALSRMLPGVQDRIKSLRFYRRGGVVWATQLEGAVRVDSDRGISLDQVYDKDAIVNFAYYQKKAVALSRGYPMAFFDGGHWSQSTLNMTPGFGCAISRRLAVAGFDDEPTVVHICRADDISTFPENETDDDSETRAAFIDVGNLLGTADEITGLGAFEAKRLAIFTADQALLYALDVAISSWSIDERANIRVGCASAATIRNAGTDLIFCSRYGVHAITRNENNVILPVTLSAPIEKVYRALVRALPDTQLMSALYDDDNGLYHIYIPKPGTIGATRLTLNLRAGYQKPQWSVGDTLTATCGDALAGLVVVGTPGGVYSQLQPDLTLPVLSDLDAQRGTVEVLTPILWMGNSETTKDAVELLVRAAGEGKLELTGYDEEGEELLSVDLDIEGADEQDDELPDTTLANQYAVPFAVRFRGLQLQIKSSGAGNIELVSVAIKLQGSA